MGAFFRNVISRKPQVKKEIRINYKYFRLWDFFIAKNLLLRHSLDINDNYRRLLNENRLKFHNFVRVGRVD